MALWGARTLFGIDGGPLEMASDFFLASFSKTQGKNMSKLEFCHKSNLECPIFIWCTFLSSILIALFRDTPLGYLCWIHADSQLAKIVKNSQNWLFLAIWLSAGVQ